MAIVTTLPPLLTGDPTLEQIEADCAKRLAYFANQLNGVVADVRAMVDCLALLDQTVTMLAALWLNYHSRALSPDVLGQLGEDEAQTAVARVRTATMLRIGTVVDVIASPTPLATATQLGFHFMHPQGADATEQARQLEVLRHAPAGGKGRVQ